jgi:endonuclease III
MDRRRKARDVDSRLAGAFGSSMPDRSRDLALELVHAILSQNTSRRNYNEAYARLVAAYPTAELIAKAPLSGIERAIRPGGLSRQKSGAIKSALSRVKSETGNYSLDFIHDMKVPEARAFLTSLPGVGPKTASVVLMFGDRRKVLPVDTHVLRTSKRIGLIDRGSSAEKAEVELEALVPPSSRPRMHLNLVHLGREICRARNPHHEICPVNAICDYYQSSRGRR